MRWSSLARILGGIGSLGMLVFFATQLVAQLFLGLEDGPRAVLLPSILAMLIGLPFSWALEWSERGGKRGSRSTEDRDR